MSKSKIKNQKSKINTVKLLKSRWKFLLVTISSGFLFIILPTLIITYYSNAAPYKPPPPPPPAPPPVEEPKKKEEPIPPPEEEEEKIERPGEVNETNPPPPPPPTEIPTPTPCLPNWCFVKQTECCFDPICIFLSETDKAKNNRCPKPPPSDVQYLGSKKPANLEEENPNIIYSIFNLIFSPKKENK